MSGLQLAGGLVLLLWAIARLRRSFRANAGGDGGPFSRQRVHPSWRFRPRPPVSDNPILWRERYTSRSGIAGRIVGYCILLGIYIALGYFTFFFARRASVELWHHGFTAVSVLDYKPELNLVLRFFMQDSGPNVPIDAARVDFNLFLRFTSAFIMFMLVLVASGTALETLASERAKDTWSSLIATPLSGRDILRGKLLASIWRIRGLLITILALWTLGLISGAIHPLGYLSAVLTLVSGTAFFLVAGLLAALRVEDHATAASRGLGLVILPLGSGILPFLLPAGIGSIAWGVASTPLVTWLSLVSYREMSYAWQYAVYPLFRWTGLNLGDGSMPVLLTCFAGIVAPALGARWIWNYSVANFDRLVGRPWTKEPESFVPELLRVPANVT